jgi:hypothetical protein
VPFSLPALKVMSGRVSKKMFLCLKLSTEIGAVFYGKSYNYVHFVTDLYKHQCHGEISLQSISIALLFWAVNIYFIHEILYIHVHLFSI